jgi:hypothetical protein
MADAQHVVDSIPGELSSDAAGVQRIVDIDVTFDEEGESFHLAEGVSRHFGLPLLQQMATPGQLGALALLAFLGCAVGAGDGSWFGLQLISVYLINYYL